MHKIARADQAAAYPLAASTTKPKTGVIVTAPRNDTVFVKPDTIPVDLGHQRHPYALESDRGKLDHADEDCELPPWRLCGNAGKATNAAAARSATSM